MSIHPDPDAQYQKISYAERSEFYESEHATQMDAEFLASFLTPEVRTVLEVPCGVGRNVFHLATCGVSVMGIDIEQEMVNQAQARQLSDVYKHIRGKIEFRQGDMCELSLARKFDFVFTPIDAFQLLGNDDDAIRALVSLSNCLSEQGSLLIDLARFGNPAFSTESRPVFYDPDQPDGAIVREWIRRLPGGGTLTRSRRQQHHRRTMRFRFYYDVSNGTEERHLFTDLELRTYSRVEIETLIKAANLQIVASFGDHNRGVIAAHSARLIYQLKPI